METTAPATDKTSGAALSRLIDLCIALTSDRSTSAILSELMHSVKKITRADGGTLYLLTKDGTGLRPVLIRNDSLGINSGSDASAISKSLQIPLFNGSQPNQRNLVACAVNGKAAISVEDRQSNSDYDFSGAEAFDQRFNYQSKSFLTLPLVNAEENCLGAIQLVNARDESGDIKGFEGELIHYAQGIASLAASALTNRHTVQDLEQLFEYFVELLALMNDQALGADSGSAQSAPVLALSLAKTLHNLTDPPFTSFKLTDTVLREIKIAGWLRTWALQHRKALKQTTLRAPATLELIIRQRAEVIQRDIKLTFYEALNSTAASPADAKNYETNLAALTRDVARIEALVNSSTPSANTLKDLGSRYSFTDRDGVEQPLITEQEAEMLASSANATEATVPADAILGILINLRLPATLGQALQIANLRSLLNDEVEQVPVALDGRAQLVYDTLRATERLSAMLSAQTNNAAHTMLQVLKQLYTESDLNPDIVEVLINRKLGT